MKMSSIPFIKKNLKESAKTSLQLHSTPRMGQVSLISNISFEDANMRIQHH